MYFFGGDFLGEERLAGVMVGDEEMIGGRARPGRIDLNRVCDDGDDGDSRSGVKLALYHVWIERVSIYNDVGLELLKKAGDGVFGLGDEGEGRVEVLLISGAIDPSPNTWGVGGDFSIDAAEKVIDAWVAEVAGVGHEDLRFSCEGVGEVSGGAVMAIAKAGGEDQYFRLHTIGFFERSNRDLELRRLSFAGSFMSIRYG